MFAYREIHKKILSIFLVFTPRSSMCGASCMYLIPTNTIVQTTCRLLVFKLLSAAVCFFITSVHALLWEQFGGKTPVHFVRSFTKSTCGWRALDKDDVLRHLYADVSNDVCLSWAHKNHKSH